MLSSVQKSDILFSTCWWNDEVKMIAREEKNLDYQKYRLAEIHKILGGHVAQGHGHMVWCHTQLDATWPLQDSAGCGLRLSDCTFIPSHMQLHFAPVGFQGQSGYGTDASLFVDLILPWFMCFYNEWLVYIPTWVLVVLSVFSWQVFLCIYLCKSDWIHYTSCTGTSCLVGFTLFLTWLLASFKNRFSLEHQADSGTYLKHAVVLQVPAHVLCRMATIGSGTAQVKMVERGQSWAVDEYLGRAAAAFLRVFARFMHRPFISYCNNHHWTELLAYNSINCLLCIKIPS